MITVGLKLTQRGGIAVIRDNRLEFGVELEPPDGGSGPAAPVDLAAATRLLTRQNYDLDDVTGWAVDGWAGSKFSDIRLRDNVDLRLAPYRESDWLPDPAQPGHLGEFELGGRIRPYASYAHTATHLAAAYCTSPFAARREPCLVLVWDGGSFPLLYQVDERGHVRAHGELFPLIGRTVAEASRRFGATAPATGVGADEVNAVVRELFDQHFGGDTPSATEFRSTIVGCGSAGEPSTRYVTAFLDALSERARRLSAGGAIVLAGVRALIEELLTDRISDRVQSWAGRVPVNLCFAGGCAVDAALATAVRSHPRIAELWVPPFADDSGSAIGAAALHIAAGTGLRRLDWTVRVGPELGRHTHEPAGWSVSPCRPEELARMMHRGGQPVVLLAGRAKLGRSALGARSIVAPATDPAMTGLLGRLGGGARPAPVTAVCLPRHAADVFEPGTTNAFTGFEHRVRPEWSDRVPAVSRAGGAVRLQTIDAAVDPALATVLREYHVWSGVPVLCAVDAAVDGGECFPDVLSALRWGGVDMVWSEGVLHRRVRDNIG